MSMVPDGAAMIAGRFDVAMLVELVGRILLLDGVVLGVLGETLIHGRNGATFAALDGGGPIGTTDDGGATFAAAADW